jgi:hypothetical protein
MLSRCTNPNSKYYSYYGGRGIKVCWSSFEDFLAYVLATIGECPPGKSIDRWPDKNGNYEPGNVRWATQKQQVDNRRQRKDGVSAEQACAIRADPRSHRTIAADYNISHVTVGNIKTRKTWRNV